MNRLNDIMPVSNDKTIKVMPGKLGITFIDYYFEPEPAWSFSITWSREKLAAF